MDIDIYVGSLWRKDIDEELQKSFVLYFDKFHTFPDTIIGISYDDFISHEFALIIKVCIEKNQKIDEFWRKNVGFSPKGIYYTY